MEHCRRAGQCGHSSGAQYSDCAKLECFLGRYLKGARRGPCPLSCWKDVFLTSPAWPTPVCLAPAFAYCQLREDPGPALNHLVLVVDLASPLVTRPYGYSFFIHSGIYQSSRHLPGSLCFCFLLPLIPLSFSLSSFSAGTFRSIIQSKGK